MGNGTSLKILGTDLISLADRKKALEAELKSVKEQIDGVKGQLFDEFQENGLDRVTLDGRNITLTRQIWSKKLADGSVVCDALREAGLSSYVYETYNTSRMSAWMREQPQDNDGAPILPPELEGVLGYSEVFDLRVTKAAKKAGV